MEGKSQQTTIQFFSVDGQQYAVHVNDTTPFTGTAYPLSDYTTVGERYDDTERNWSYYGKGGVIVTDDPDEAYAAFTFEYTTSSEAKIRFSQEEYFAGEVEHMMLIWQQIDAYLKKKLNG